MNSRLLIAGSSAVSLAVGTVAGYFYAKQKLEKDYLERLEADTEILRAQYKTLYKKETTPEELLAKRRETAATIAMQEYRVPGQDMHPALKDDNKNLLEESQAAVPDETVANLLDKMKNKPWPGDPRPDPSTLLAARAPKVEVRNIFTDQPSPHTISNYERNDYESPSRGPLTAEPFIIDEETFNESENRTMEFTYYEGDNSLTGSDDHLFDDGEIAQFIGDINNLQFGNQSNDSSIVYIRNPRLGIDIEVCLDERTYKAVVAGIEE